MGTNKYAEHSKSRREFYKYPSIATKSNARCLGKIPFRTEEAAKQKALKVALEYGSTPTYYKCPHCLFFHLTNRKATIVNIKT